MSDYTPEQLARDRELLAQAIEHGLLETVFKQHWPQVLDALESAWAEVERIHLHNANVLQLINDAAHKLKSSIAHLAEDDRSNSVDRLDEAVDILLKATQSFAERQQKGGAE